MADYVLSCESMADLTPEKFEEIGVECIYFHYSIDDKEYLDDLGQTVPFDQFYQAMRDGAETKTSALGVGEYQEFFRTYLDQGKDILHVCLSSGLSATVDSARVAAEELRGEYPDRKIHIVDSLGASAGFGLLMQGLSDRRAEGMGVDELYEWAQVHRRNVQHWFFSTDLTFYIRGGRVKPVAGFVGNLLGICPLLNVDFEGKLIPREKLRSKKKAYKRIVEKMSELAEGRDGYTGKVFISNSDCMEDAQAVAALVEKTFPNMDGKVEISSIGTGIGSHTGPGTVAMFFWGDERVD